MEWTDADQEYLLQFRNTVDSDEIKVKEQVKRKLIENKYIIHVLNNKELEEAEAEPDEYFGKAIMPYYIIEPTQTNVQNFICFTVGFDKVYVSNKVMKRLMLTFEILCEQKTAIDEDTSTARQDLLAALIKDQFNYTNIFGAKIICVENKELVVDTNYAARRLIFEQLTDNNLVKSTGKLSTTRLINKEIVT